MGDSMDVRCLNKGALLIGLILILLVTGIVVGGFWYFYLREQSPSSAVSQDQKTQETKNDTTQGNNPTVSSQPWVLNDNVDDDLAIIKSADVEAKKWAPDAVLTMLQMINDAYPFNEFRQWRFLAFSAKTKPGKVDIIILDYNNKIVKTSETLIEKNQKFFENPLDIKSVKISSGTAFNTGFKKLSDLATKSEAKLPNDRRTDLTLYQSTDPKNTTIGPRWHFGTEAVIQGSTKKIWQAVSINATSGRDGE
jgi:hypothetical protein